MWKIVIIDDDPNVLAGMKTGIPWETLNAEWAGEGTDGQQGLVVIRQVQPDIVIVDISMPVMNGLDMIGTLRNEGYAGKFIILSGYSDFEYARQALRLDVDDYLTKPVTVDSLIAVLKRAIHRLDKNNQEQAGLHAMLEQMQQYESYIVKEWLKSAVTGTPHPQTVRLDAIDACIQRWEGQRHLVVGIELVDTLKLINWKRHDWNLLLFALENVIRELLAGEWTDFEYINLHSHRAVVLLHDDGRRLADDELILQAERFANIIPYSVHRNLRLSVRVGIGGVKSGFREFADSFDEAFRQCSASRPLFAAVRSIRFYHQLVEAVRNCQESQAFGLIDEYVSHLKELKQISSAELTQLGNELWTILAYSLYDLGIELERIRPRFEIPEAETLEHLADWLHSIVSDILRSRHWNDNIKHKQAVDFMINYIREHYNEEITLGDLSRHVFISQNYLGQIFKNVVGETLNQYVTRIRMDKAKELVLEGKYYIYEIAEKVGYSNIPYFTTQFKKQIGFNPSELLKK